MKHPCYDVLIAIAEGKPVQYFLHNEWFDFDSNNSFIIAPSLKNQWRVKPKEKVKKYRWVLQDARDERILKVSDNYYANLAEFNAKVTSGIWCTAVEPIEATMIEVEVDD